VGQALLEALLDRARALPELEQIELTVTEGNRRAQALYERNGFRVWGVRPQAVKLDGQAYAKIHMVCRLR
jgi:RimJ/RimL family protein N-acetyltransferase